MFGFFLRSRSEVVQQHTRPAFRCNLFIAFVTLSAVEGHFLKAIKRISSTIGARLEGL
jgi:hypothetical protein